VDGSVEVLLDEGVTAFDLGPDDQKILCRSGDSWGGGRVQYVNLSDGRALEMQGLGAAKAGAVSLDPTGEVAVTGDGDGRLRVSSLTGEDPHILIGLSGAVWGVDISPDGRWIASGGEDGAVRLWPMPDLSKPPLHTLPRSELIAKLKTLTNLRVVRDEESSTGWTLTYDPFPGWEQVSTW
jgi:WD40 repeat protein